MVTVFATAVDSSIGFTKREYYFKYKGCDFKYVPQYKKHNTDDFICIVKKGKTIGYMYELMTELMSAIAFDRDAKIIVYSGLSCDLDLPLKEIDMSVIQKRTIPVEEMMTEFYYVSPLTTNNQIQLSRLYRQATFSNNIYTKILFYWHALVYPASNDDEAIAYLDDLDKDLPKNLDYMKEKLNRIKTNKVLTPEGKSYSSLGRYLKECIRHSIAHIVRDQNKGVDLIIDSWEQESHLYDVCDFLKIVTKARLISKFNMHAPHNIEIFHYINF